MLVKSTVFTVFSFTLVFRNIYCKPALDPESNPLTICYSLNCPESTKVCGKHSEVSTEDRTKLIVQIRCYDDEGNILKSKNGTEDNPYGPNVYYKGTKISAVIKMRPSYFFGAEPDPDQDDEESNNVPTYLNFPSYPVQKSGPKSEVEDLNSR